MRWLDIIFANSKSTGTKRVVMLILARHANRRGDVRLPYREIGLLACRSAQTVKEALAALGADGELRLIGQGGGHGKANTYRILVRPLRDLTLNKLPE